VYGAVFLLIAKGVMAPRAKSMISIFKSTPPEKNFPATYPLLPEHLDKLLDEAWTSENSRQIDLWLWYVQQEFELVGGDY
jgi:hypothetical protein